LSLSAGIAGDFGSSADGGATACDPYHVKVVTSICDCLLEFARHCFYVDNSLFLIVDRCLRLRRFAPSC
jgi:hypothetical protein